MKKIRLVCLLLSLAQLLSGCGSGTQQQEDARVSPARQGVTTTDAGFYFDTAVTIRLYDAEEGLMEEIWQACERYEQLFSKTVEGSDVWRINHAEGEPVQVAQETWEVLQ